MLYNSKMHIRSIYRFSGIIQGRIYEVGRFKVNPVFLGSKMTNAAAGGITDVPIPEE